MMGEAPQTGKNGKQVLKEKGPAIVLAAVLLVLWQVAADAVGKEHIFPGPVAVLRRTWELRATLLLHQLPTTLRTILEGWAISIAIALVLASLMDLSVHAQAMIYPVLVVTQTVPVMCISPLFVIWFGYTQAARLTSVVLSTFFAITLNTFDGLRSADADRRELMQSLGASRWQIFLRLEVPSALPMFMTGLRMTLPWAVIDAAVAEWLGATQGLGYFSKRMITKMDGPAVFAPILILTIMALIGMALIDLLDRKVAWYRDRV